jgi:protoheme IX farnesyltransferase
MALINIIAVLKLTELKETKSLTLCVHFLNIWAQLAKIRLTLLVIFSSVVSYFTLKEQPVWTDVFFLFTGGLFITAASNTFNQYYEIQTDSLMERTKFRPLPSGIIGKKHALWLGIGNMITGSVFLLQLGFLPFIFGLASFLLYVFVYTPLKKRTPWAVFAGAFPGSFPVLIGVLASNPENKRLWVFGILLFLIQFIWQFPHFWSLAWFNFDDYARADFFLLPSGKEKNQNSAFQVFIYSIFLGVIALIPFFLKLTGPVSALSILICGMGIVWQAYLFYRHPDDAMARKVFLITLVYLPVVQLSLLTGV